VYGTARFLSGYSDVLYRSDNACVVDGCSECDSVSAVHWDRKSVRGMGDDSTGCSSGIHCCRPMTDDSVFASLQSVTGTTYDNSTYNKDLLDVFLLHKARQKGVRLPTGGAPDEYKYLGAFVETPTAGMNENVVYCDLASLYPNNILSLNASPETIVGTKEDLEQSQYTEEDCVWGYVDPRPVKHLDENYNGWRQYTDGQYKMVYDPHAPDIKWTCDDADGPQYERLYFLSHDIQRGFLTECVDELIALKNKYRGTPH